MLSTIAKPQTIHIIAEVIIIVIIAYYLNSRCNKLLLQIDSLTHVVEDQENIINKHGEIIQQLTAKIQQLDRVINSQQYQQQPVPVPVRSKNMKHIPVQQKNKLHAQPPVNHPKLPVKVQNVKFNNNNYIKEEDEEDDDGTDEYVDEIEKDSDIEEDIDAELSEELEDLKKQK